MAKSLIVLIVLCYFGHIDLFAQSIVEPGAIEAQGPIQLPQPFGDNQFGLNVNRNYPLSTTRQSFAPSPRLNLSITYHRTLSVDWLAGIEGGFKSLEFKERGGTFNILSLTHEIYRLVRIYHPWYFGVGYRVQYLAPVIRQAVPTERLPEADAEIGVAASLMLMTRIAPGFVASTYLDRWRGTKTNALHGYEVAVGISYDGVVP